MSGTIHTTVSDGVLTIVIDNEDRRNAVNDDMLEELAEQARRANDPDVRSVVLRGAGDRAFCAGFDLAAVTADSASDKAEERSQRIEAVCAALEELDVVVIGALNGDTVGVGLELASACDLRVGRAGIRLGLPAVRLGVHYRREGAARIAAACGRGLFQRILHTGRLVPADIAHAAGLVSDLVSAEDFDESVDELARQLAAVDRSLQRHNKDLVRQSC